MCVLFVEDEPLIRMGTASLAWGAVEIVMEALDADVAQKIERKRLHFHNSRDGVSHSAKVPPGIGAGLAGGCRVAEDDGRGVCADQGLVAMVVGDDIDELVAQTDARLTETARSDAMRSAPYRLSLGVLVAFTQLLASVARRLQSPVDDPVAVRAEVRAAASRQGRLIASLFNRRMAMVVGGVIGGAFILGAVRSGLSIYSLSAGHFQVDGAILCRAAGMVTDAKGPQFYPVMEARR